MKINDIIQSKGSAVVTATPEQDIGTLARLLAAHRIGAVVVVDDAGRLVGVAGERDVVRAIAEHGAAGLQLPISQFLPAQICTCALDDEVAEVAGTMTEFRARHVPVLVDGKLAAIVSIGDIVKHRIDQLQAEREHLVSYLHG
ncbi:MAG TPA: CBS domain-containing protein [Arachnia sp.]|nr:CBS domain-containing protein [Arachnia sp.]